jgi:hypothetical protein
MEIKDSTGPRKKVGEANAVHGKEIVKRVENGERRMKRMIRHAEK